MKIIECADSLASLSHPQQANAVAVLIPAVQRRFRTACWRWNTLLLGLLLVGGVTQAATRCDRHSAAAPALQRLQAVMATGRFIAYQPTALQVINGKATNASVDSLRQDLRVLRQHFDGLITYGSANGAERVADVAATLGYRAVIMGVWDVDSASERANVLAAIKRQPQLIVGVSLGNERWFASQKTPAQLAALLQEWRRRMPSVPVTTTEPFHLFMQDAAARLLAASDFMLVNVHPIFQPWFRTAPDSNAADFVVNVATDLQAKACGPVLVKETGVPTAPASMGYTPQRQASFYAVLQQRFRPSSQRAFAWFSAFDAPWREFDDSPVAGTHPEEAHFGLYDEQRVPKLVVQQLDALPSARDKP